MRELQSTTVECEHQRRYRGLHHSFLGHIDLTVCGNSDPGTSGLLTPYSKMDGLYFDGGMEPDNFLFEFKKRVKDTIKNKGAKYITVDFSNKEDYYAMMNAMQTFNDEQLSVITTSDENDLRIIVMDEIDLDSREPRNAPPTRKKK